LASAQKATFRDSLQHLRFALESRQVWLPPSDRAGPFGAENLCRGRATASIDDICFEKIHGCSYRETTRLTAPCSQCNISFVFSRERNFGLVLRAHSMQACKGPGWGIQ